MKINFGGKERGFQWGLGCIEKYCELMGGDLETLDVLTDVGSVAQIKASVNLLLAAMQNHAELNDETIDFDYVKVRHWLSECDQKTSDAIMNDFADSRLGNKTIREAFSMVQDEPENTEAVKKK